MIDRLRHVLSEVKERSGNNFSGVGVIVYDKMLDMPIVPLRKTIPHLDDKEIVETLVNLSSFSSEYHDGFHLISKDWRLTHVSQYFSPPIVKEARIDRSKLFGGRYIAALFGSSLSGVLLTGIASSGFGLAIFQGGEEILFEKDQ